MHIPHADHWHTSGTLLKLGIAQRLGSYHKFLASIVFSAFALEAFLNYIGEKQFSSWRSLERLSVKGKMDVICERVKVNLDWQVSPWTIVPELVGIRNKIAHGKDSLLEEEKVVPADEYEKILNKFLLADWQKYATTANAERVRGEVEKIIKRIASAAGMKEAAILDTSGQTGSVTPAD